MTSPGCSAGGHKNRKKNKYTTVLNRSSVSDGNRSAGLVISGGGGGRAKAAIVGAPSSFLFRWEASIAIAGFSAILAMLRGPGSTKPVFYKLPKKPSSKN